MVSRVPVMKLFLSCHHVHKDSPIRIIRSRKHDKWNALWLPRCQLYQRHPVPVVCNGGRWHTSLATPAALHAVCICAERDGDARNMYTKRTQYREWNAGPERGLSVPRRRHISRLARDAYSQSIVHSCCSSDSRS